MPRRAASRTSSLINRTGESGGSMGGNSKTGVVSFSRYPNINLGYLSSRTDTGKCCIDAHHDTTNDTTNDVNDDTVDIEDVPVDSIILPVSGYGPVSTWSTTISHSSGGSTTYYSNGAIIFQGDTLPHPAV